MKTGLGEEESSIEIEKRKKPVKKDAQGLINFACNTVGITSLSLASLCHIKWHRRRREYVAICNQL